MAARGYEFYLRVVRIGSDLTLYDEPNKTYRLALVVFPLRENWTPAQNGRYEFSRALKNREAVNSLG